MRTPAKAFNSGIKGISTGQTINTDKIQIVTSTFNEEATGQYTFVAVFWQEETKRVKRARHRRMRPINRFSESPSTSRRVMSLQISN